MLKMDGKLFLILTRAWDMAVISLVYAVCLLPVFTVGAATAAIYSLHFAAIEGEYEYNIKHFIRRLSENFKQATKLWLIELAAILLMAASAWAAFWLRAVDSPIYLVLFSFCLATFLLMDGWIFPLCCRYDAPLVTQLKNAALITFTHLPISIIVLALSLIIPSAILLCPLKFLPALLFFITIIGLPLLTYIKARLTLKLLKKLEKQ